MGPPRAESCPENNYAATMASAACRSTKLGGGAHKLSSARPAHASTLKMLNLYASQMFLCYVCCTSLKSLLLLTLNSLVIPYFLNSICPHTPVNNIQLSQYMGTRTKCPRIKCHLTRRHRMDRGKIMLP